MRFFLFLLLITLLQACSSTERRTANLREKILAEEARTLAEIKSHAGLLIESHPELTLAAKEKIQRQIHNVIDRHQELKEQESKVINLLISDSLEQKDKPKDDALLRKELDNVYQAKEENVLSLVNLIQQMGQSQELSDEFDRDVEMFFREFR